MNLNWNIDSNPKIRIGIRKFEFPVNRNLLHNFILLMVVQRNSTRESNKVLSFKVVIEPCCTNGKSKTCIEPWRNVVLSHGK